ncbi:MAG: NAD-dependent deacylase [Syntrophobacteraceae bacterium]|jgi:NAD-dependent deacetylase|nr:NAD-dependent deacylase [Syntrophobacteraceae bacterium]
MVALTGAGISVESGIPDFRSEDGLWSRYEPMEYGHIRSFRANPRKVWKMLREMDALLGAAMPNPAHLALARLEERSLLKAVITQNVDSLHQKAGSRRVIEFHGHGRTLRCDECGGRVRRDGLILGEDPPRCACGSAMRPDFVFFGEEIPREAHGEAVEMARSCDVMLVVGTSAAVAPASHLPHLARKSGAAIIVIDPRSIELPSADIDLHIAKPAGKTLPALVEALDQLETE